MRVRPNPLHSWLHHLVLVFLTGFAGGTIIPMFFGACAGLLCCVFCAVSVFGSIDRTHTTGRRVDPYLTLTLTPMLTPTK